MKPLISLIFFQLFVIAIANNGTKKFKVISRISRGKSALPKQIPYQVHLTIYNKYATSCGGTLISNEWVVTAAHCFDKNFSHVLVALGQLNQRDQNDPNRKILSVANKNVIIHPDWSLRPIKNDIALVKLPYPVKLNEYIKPVELPKIEEHYSQYDGEFGIASGWGRTSDHPVEYSPDILQWARMPIITNDECNQFWKGNVISSQMCISTTGGISPCKGDSGGPLVLYGDKPVLIGITSYGKYEECELGLPEVFTRITSYLLWIKELTGVANQ